MRRHRAHLGGGHAGCERRGAADRSALGRDPVRPRRPGESPLRAGKPPPCEARLLGITGRHGSERHAPSVAGLHVRQATCGVHRHDGDRRLGGGREGHHHWQGRRPASLRRTCRTAPVDSEPPWQRGQETHRLRSHRRVASPTCTGFPEMTMPCGTEAVVAPLRPGAVGRGRCGREATATEATDKMEPGAIGAFGAFGACGGICAVRRCAERRSRMPSASASRRTGNSRVIRPRWQRRRCEHAGQTVRPVRIVRRCHRCCRRQLGSRAAGASTRRGTNRRHPAPAGRGDDVERSEPPAWAARSSAAKAPCAGPDAAGAGCSRCEPLTAGSDRRRGATDSPSRHVAQFKLREWDSNPLLDRQAVVGVVGAREAKPSSRSELRGDLRGAG